MGCAIGMLETYGLLSAIEGLDAALKAANVTLRSFDYVSGGLIAWFVEGEVGAVRVAVSAGKAAASRLGKVVSDHVIARPAKDVEKTLSPPAGPGGRKGGTGIHKRDFPIKSLPVSTHERVDTALPIGKASPVDKTLRTEMAPLTDEAQLTDKALLTDTAPPVDEAPPTDKAPFNQVSQAVTQVLTKGADATPEVAQKQAPAANVAPPVDKAPQKPKKDNHAATDKAKASGGSKQYTREELQATGIYELRAIARQTEGIGLKGVEIRDSKKSILIAAILDAQNNAGR